MKVCGGGRVMVVSDLPCLPLFGPVVVRYSVGSFTSIPIPLPTHISSKASPIAVDNRKKYL